MQAKRLYYAFKMISKSDVGHGLGPGKQNNKKQNKTKQKAESHIEGCSW